MLHNDKLYFFNHGAKSMVNSNSYPRGSWPNSSAFIDHAEELFAAWTDDNKKFNTDAVWPFTDSNTGE
jgi:hypothetical protein